MFQILLFLFLGLVLLILSGCVVVALFWAFLNLIDWFLSIVSPSWSRKHKE